MDTFDFANSAQEPLHFQPQILRGQVLHQKPDCYPEVLDVQFQVCTEPTMTWRSGFYWHLEQKALICTCIIMPDQLNTKRSEKSEIFFKPENGNDCFEVNGFTVTFSAETGSPETNKTSKFDATTEMVDQKYHVNVTEANAGNKEYSSPCVLVAKLSANLLGRGGVTIATRRSEYMRYKLA